MPLEEKLHAVPYLKALTSSLEPLSGHRHDSTFTHHYTLLKTTHFASYTGQVAVYCEGSCKLMGTLKPYSNPPLGISLPPKQSFGNTSIVSTRMNSQ